MRKANKYTWLGILVVLLPLLTGACNRTRNNPGYDYFPDMYYSFAYETWSPNPNFSDGSTMLSPVEGTIPRDMIPFPYKKSPEDAILAGKELVNPLHASEENLERGQRMYDIFCMNCHGEAGDGKGYLFTSGKYLYPPASLVTAKVIDQPDGQICHSITVGYGIMGAHGAMISQDDRWKIILYIRNTLQKKNP